MTQDPKDSYPNHYWEDPVVKNPVLARFRGFIEEYNLATTKAGREEAVQKAKEYAVTEGINDKVTWPDKKTGAWTLREPG